MAVKSIRDFDELVTRRMLGFATNLEYYEGISRYNYILPLILTHISVLKCFQMLIFRSYVCTPRTTQFFSKNIVMNSTYIYF